MEKKVLGTEKCPVCKKMTMSDAPTKFQRVREDKDGRFHGIGKVRWGYYCYTCETWVKNYRKPCKK